MTAPDPSRLAGWGRLMAVHRRWVLLGWLALTLVMGAFSTQTARLLAPGGFNAGTEAERTAEVLQRQFPQRTSPVLLVVLQSATASPAEPAFAAQVAAWRADLVRLSRGLDVTVGPPSPGRDGHTVALFVTSDRTPDHFLDLGKQVHATRHGGPAAVYVGGQSAVFDTFISDSESDLQTAERVSLPIALALLLVVFGGLVAAGLPVLTGIATVSVAVALLGFVARGTAISVFALNVSSVVGLGLGIDYSLLVVNRFRDEVHAGRPLVDAIGVTVRTAGLATAVSGGTVMIGFGALLLSPINTLRSIGIGGALVVGVSVVASLTLIPALLGLLGSRIDRLALPLVRARGSDRLWGGIASGVMRRPLTFIVLSLVVVGVLVAPAHAFNPGVVGLESLPPGDQAVTAQRVVQEQFGLPEHPPILVVARGATSTQQRDAVAAALHRAAGTAVTGPDDVPASRRPLFLAPPDAVFEVAQPAGDNDPSTRALLDRLRALSWPAGVQVSLGGEAAAYQDFLSVLGSNLPLILGTVLGLTLLLLGVVFRSVVLPVKAVLMNLLSVGAAVGVLTFVFQQGHLSGPLDFQAVGFVDATIPLIIFAALFGLSMDYEVFLLARIREEYMAGRSNTDAVARGMARTGRIITSAALIMVVVFSSLALSHLVINKAFGVTFTVAILVDATVIRLLLVPAMMRVLGHLNWWPSRRPVPGPEAVTG